MSNSSNEDGSLSHESETSNKNEDIGPGLGDSESSTSYQGSKFDIDSGQIDNAAIGDTVNQYNYFMGNSGNIYGEASSNISEYRILEDELYEVQQTFVRTDQFKQLVGRLPRI